MEWVWVVLQVVAVIVYGNLLEWLVHKYILHKLGSTKLVFGEHWYRHHRNTRLNDYGDPDYQQGQWSWKGRWSEVIGLSFLGLIHLPVVFFYPVAYAAMVGWAALYYLVHWFNHAHPKLGKKCFPWHHDHHMGKNQNANWCVIFPLWDWILGTRVLYFL